MKETIDYNLNLTQVRIKWTISSKSTVLALSDKRGLTTLGLIPTQFIRNNSQINNSVSLRSRGSWSHTTQCRPLYTNTQFKHTYTQRYTDLPFNTQCVSKLQMSHAEGQHRFIFNKYSGKCWRQHLVIAEGNSPINQCR